MTKIKGPLFKYAGSKWRLTAHYPQPVHQTIIEPFAGRACYALHYPEREVTLCEKRPDIAQLWRWLIQADPEEIRAIPTSAVLTPGQDIRELDISEGAKLLLRGWQRVGNGWCWTVSSWGGMPGQWTPSTQARVAESVQYIRHWKVVEGDFTSIQNKPATWFIDPPYIGLPLYESKKIDYPALSAWCQSREGQAIVCEGDGAKWLPFSPLREIRNGRRGISTELIWTKGCGLLG